MKLTLTMTLILALSASGYAVAQTGAMNHEHMHMAGATASADAKAQTNPAVGVVKSANPAKGTVSIAHEAIPSLKWPPMTMAFVVKDKKLFDKLAVGSKVNFEIAQQGSDYVITSVK